MHATRGRRRGGSRHWWTAALQPHPQSPGSLDSEGHVTGYPGTLVGRKFTRSAAHAGCSTLTVDRVAVGNSSMLLANLPRVCGTEVRITLTSTVDTSSTRSPDASTRSAPRCLPRDSPFFAYFWSNTKCCTADVLKKPGPGRTCGSSVCDVCVGVCDVCVTCV